MTPPKHVGRQGQNIPLRGLPLDSAGRIVHGIRITYSSSNSAVLTVDGGSGIASLLQPGLAWVSASAGAASARVPILVLPGTRAMQTDAQWDADQAMLNPDGTVVTGTGSDEPGLVPSLFDKLAPTVHAQTGGGDSGDFGYHELWSDPRNAVGSPPNGVRDPL